MVRIGVVFGGGGEERDISRASARQVVPALRSRGHEVMDVELETDRALELPGRLAGVDVAFLALHGDSGENGEIQALLGLAGIPYTGSSPLGSGIAMDKDISKRLFHAAGIRTPDWMMGPADPERVLYRLELPLVVKPKSQGSTVGLSLVNAPGELDEAIAVAARYGDVMFEQFIAGRELTVGVLDGRALTVGEVKIDPDTTFGYDDKYRVGAVEEVFPADLPLPVADDARQTALTAHRCLGLGSYSRSDFRLDRHGRLWLIEVNALPGLTETSLMPQSAAASDIDFALLCERICELALPGCTA